MFGDIYFAVNIDVAGFFEGSTAFSFYGCSPEVENAAKQVFKKFPDMSEGEQWYQSDHSIFIQNQTAAIAFTSSEFKQLSSNITHTKKDSVKLVDHSMIINISTALFNLVELLNSQARN